MPQIIQKFQYISLNKQDGGSKGRVYVDKNGYKIPSVTTILDATSDKSHLELWRKRVGVENANQITKDAAALGTALHTHLECYILGLPRPTGTNLGRILAKNMSDTIIEKGLVNVSEVWGSEIHLHFDTVYAGTTDLIGVHNGYSAIMDFKNTIKPKKVEWIENYFMQLAGYIMAHDSMFKTQIERGVIFMCARDCTYQEFIIEGPKLDHYKSLWSQRVEQYYEKLVFDQLSEE